MKVVGRLQKNLSRVLLHLRHLFSLKASSSYIGAEMAAVFLSVMSTVTLAGQSVWQFLEDFFESIVREESSLDSKPVDHINKQK